jgi:hypothetical protein
MMVAYFIGMLAVLCAPLTAYYWYKASKVEPMAAWDYDPSLRPRNMAEDAWGRAHATERAHMLSGRLNKIAAISAMIGAVLAVVAFFLV